MAKRLLKRGLKDQMSPGRDMINRGSIGVGGKVREEITILTGVK